MRTTEDILQEARGCVKQPLEELRRTPLTQVPTYCDHGVTTSHFSIWFGRRTGAVYIVVYGQGIYKGK